MSEVLTSQEEEDLSFVLKRQKERWYPLIPHPVQLQLIRAVGDGIRFPIVPAGRRSGKTERAKRFLVKQAMYEPNRKLFAGAPTVNQAKKIWWTDLKELSFSSTHFQKPSETELVIHFPNGSQIYIIGFDAPQRFEGIPWDGGVIDEVADVKEQAVVENILPALNTFNPTRPDYRAWCWFIGVPEGLGHYKDMSDRGYSDHPDDKDYKTFHWISADILPADVIEGAKRSMSLKQYKQEYEASFETAGGRIYDDYNKDNWCDTVVNPLEELHWTHDQNFTPLSSAIIVFRNGNPHIVDEVVLESAISEQAAHEFCERYENHANKTLFLYGDPAGRAGEKHGHKSDYEDIEDVLRMNKWKVIRRVKPKHPAIKDRQNSVRRKICNALGERTLFVNPKNAKWCDKGLSTVQLKEGSSFQEDQKNQYQHITTAIGYFSDWHFPAGQIQTKSGTTVGTNF